MNKREIKAWLKDEVTRMEPAEDMEGNKILSVYLGSFLSLDPCGRYHHAISPNGVSSRCERFWENLENVASDLGGWIESGEGDPLDTFFCMPGKEEEEEEEEAEPQPEDIAIQDCGPLGSWYSVGVVDGKNIGEYRTWEEATNAIKEYMKDSNFFPTVWKISDHGNAEMVKL